MNIMTEKIEFKTGDEVTSFYCIEETTFEECTYLLVSDTDMSDDETSDMDEEANAYILKKIAEQDEDVVYEMVEDERVLAALSGIFNELLSDSDFSIE